jgi:hypothetical protein
MKLKKEFSKEDLFIEKNISTIEEGRIHFGKNRNNIYLIIFSFCIIGTLVLLSYRSSKTSDNSLINNLTLTNSILFGIFVLVLLAEFYSPRFNGKSIIVNFLVFITLLLSFIFNTIVSGYDTDLYDTNDLYIYSTTSLGLQTLIVASIFAWIYRLVNTKVGNNYK